MGFWINFNSKSSLPLFQLPCGSPCSMRSVQTHMCRVFYYLAWTIGWQVALLTFRLWKTNGARHKKKDGDTTRDKWPEGLKNMDYYFKRKKKRLNSLAFHKSGLSQTQVIRTKKYNILHRKYIFKIKIHTYIVR